MKLRYLFCLLILFYFKTAHGNLFKQVFPKPQREIEEIILEYLHNNGYSTQRFITSEGEIKIVAIKSNKWEIIIRPFSPLATIVAINPFDEEQKKLIDAIKQPENGYKEIENQKEINFIPEAVLNKLPVSVCLKNSQNSSQCSGVFIDKNLILSTAHGLIGIEKVRVTLIMVKY